MGKKLTFIGAGSPYVPVIVSEIISNYSNRINIDEVVFIAPTTEHMNIISMFCKGLFLRNEMSPKITTSLSVNESIQDSDIIFLIYRIGSAEARIKDEKIGLDIDIISQESQGVGGFSSALRNIGYLKTIAPLIHKYASNAMVISLTNPTGIMTCAANRLGLNSIGICESPYALCKSVAELKNIPISNLSFNFLGLNHLGWLVDVSYNNKSLMKDILSDKNLNTISKYLLPSHVKLSKEYIDFIKAINALPTSYVAYYYYSNDILAEQQRQLKSGFTRGEEVILINKELYEQFSKNNYAEWPKFFTNKRSGYLLGETIAGVVYDILSCGDSQKIHIICVKNNKAISNISEDVTIEIPVRFTEGRPVPVYNDTRIAGNIYSIMENVAEYELLTVKAALLGNYDLALQALVTHPLISDVDTACELLNRILKQHKDFLPQFKGKKID